MALCPGLPPPEGAVAQSAATAALLPPDHPEAQLDPDPSQTGRRLRDTGAEVLGVRVGPEDMIVLTGGCKGAGIGLPGVRAAGS